VLDMIELQRLTEYGANDFEARLLSAGRKDAPSARSRRYVLTGLGVGGGSLAAATTVKASWLESVARASLVRWGVGSFVGAAAVWSGVNLVTPEQPKPAARALSGGSAALVSPAVVAPAPSVAAEVAPVDTAPAPEPAKVSSNALLAPKRAAPAAPAAERSSLSQELTALESARRALGNGDSQRALRTLEEYSRRFSAPRLSSEATVLRIEALLASGSRQKAEDLARGFLTRNPNSPHERRVRALLGKTRERGASSR
jgi:hypothetical protein